MYVSLSAREIRAIQTNTIAGLSLTQAIKNMYFTDENGQPTIYLYFKWFVNVERNSSLYAPKYEYADGLL